MRLVILTGDGIEHRYVSGRLADAFPTELQAIIVARPRRRRWDERLRSYWRRYTVGQILSRVAARVYARMRGKEPRRLATLRRLLFPLDDLAHMSRLEMLRVVPGHSSRECLELLRELRPNVIAVYGTAVIKQPVMDLASDAILNLHTGLSPWYRGSDTIFWPLHNEEPEMVGVTVHMLDAAIDGGAIVATGRLRIDPDDDEDALFSKAVVKGTELYIDAIRAAAAGTMRAEPQPSTHGREYRFVDRTIWAERRVERLLARGLLRRTKDASTPDRTPQRP